MSLVNFLPESYLIARRRRWQMIRQSCLVGAVLLVMGGWYLSEEIMAGRLEKQVLEVESQAKIMSSVAEQASALEEELGVLEREADHQRLVLPSLSMTHVLATVGKLLPSTMVVTQLKASGADPMKALSHSLGTKRGNAQKPNRHQNNSSDETIRLVIVGLAQNTGDVAVFMGNLAAHPLFSNVKVVFSRPVNRQSRLVYEYRIETTVPLDREFVFESREVSLADH